ncbi:MAG: histidine kinase dimerization/phospho-acceptor domain-containing protein [Syntrophales bacterium]|nr:histidine kinase dimerization/phospho-acceptor domain-containing protein [Syntrophales bacterium]
MKEKEDHPENEMTGSPDLMKETRVISNYIIPLTVFLVVAVFVSLILVMGLMDLRRLDRTLVEFMENRGLDIVATIENVAQEDLEFLRRVLKEERTEPGFETPPSYGQEHLIQERLLSALFEVARNIDSQWQKDELTESELKVIASREKLSLIVLLDERGRIFMQSREFEQASLDVTGLIEGDHEMLASELVNILGPLVEMGLIALTRKDGSGTIVIALDSGQMKYWGAKTALKRFVGDLGWEHELAWLTVADIEGNILGRVGDDPGDAILKTELLAQEIHSVQRHVVSGKHERDGSHFLEVLAPVRLDNEVIGYARLGLKWDRPREILSENRNRMIITTIIIVLIGSLSTAGLYRNQSRQLARMDEMKKRLQRAEHLSALGRLAAGVAHEIRNPLNAISIATQRLQREYFPSDEGEKGDFQRISAIIRDEIRRLNDIIEEFVTFFRIRRMELRPYPLEEVVGRILAIMEAELEARNITVRTS